MEETLRNIAKLYLPPAAVCVVPMLMIWNVPNNTQLIWGMLGTIVMDNALKGILIAFVWFFVFSVVIIYKLMFPSYKEDTRNDVKAIRGWLRDEFKQGDAKPHEWSESAHTLYKRQDQIPGFRASRTYKEIYNLCLEGRKFAILREEDKASDAQVKKHLENEEILAEKIQKFLKYTNWVY